jgi:hypothetical protein
LGITSGGAGVGDGALVESGAADGTSEITEANSGAAASGELASGSSGFGAEPSGVPGTEAGVESAGEAEEEEQERERQRGKLRHDQNLDFAGMPLRLEGAGMRVRYDELQAINVRRLPNATFDFLRSFIECAIKEYFTAAKDPVVHLDPKASGPVQLKQCLAHLENRLSEDPVVKAGLVRLRSKQHYGDDYFTTAAALNDSNHEPDATVRAEQVNLMWAQVKPLVKLLLAGPPKRDEVAQGV